MTGRILAIIAALFLGGAAMAQGFSGLARIDAEQSRIRDAGQGAEIDLHLSQGVPYRLFTLDNPPRLVLDFQEVDWTGLRRENLIQGENLRDVQFGTYVPGWSRMVLALVGPMQVSAAGMEVDPVTAGAILSVTLDKTDAEQFAASAGAPQDRRWDLPAPEPLTPAAPRDDNAPLLVVLDPGHGGIDPGAQVEGGLDEKTLMLQFAFELGEMLVRSGQFSVQLTRDGDYFVSLERRIALAHQAGADLFISLHADSLSEGGARGSTIYTLSKEASDKASATLAERHDRSDLLSGTDLSAADDLVTDVLLDLARQETQPRSEALARAIVEGLAEQGGPLNRRPMRSAGFSVLKSADIPSVLIEIGFLSSKRDLANLRDPIWRAVMVSAIADSIAKWRDADAALKPLIRQ